MKWNHRRKNVVTKALRSSSPFRSSMVEALENRQLLSATVNILTTTGSKTVSATKVGQVINLDVWVDISGTTSGTNDGFQSVTGSIIGTQTGSGGIIGNMVSEVTPDYTASGAQNGTPVDLNGDGGLDIGSNNNAVIAGFFYPRAGGIMQDGNVSGDSQDFLVGTMTYTVTKLSSGGPTDINFRPRDITGGAYEAVWEEDGKYVTDETATLLVGAPLVVTDGNTVATGSVAGTVSKTVSGTTSAFSGVTVYLDNNNNGVLDSGDTSLTTSSTGTYDFTGLAAGTYHIREVVPSGYTQTSPTTSPTNVTLTAGQNATGENFTDTAVATSGSASLSGYVFNDVNGDGKWESNEPVLSGVTIDLFINKSGTLTADGATTTGSNGAYSFTKLAAGTYNVTEVVPSGEKLTTVGTYTITLSATTASANKNFGNEATKAGTASISGTIDKIVSGVTSAFSGVTVYLDTNDNGVFDAGEPSTTTSATGTYSFVGLAAGKYYLREVVPTGYTQTSPTTSPVTLTLTTSAVTGENFTDTATAAGTGSISGYVFDDANDDGKFEGTEKGIAGVTVYIDANNNGTLDSTEVKVTTNSAGLFTFSGLAAGTYVIREVLPSGKKLTTTASYTVTLPAGYNSTGKNFGNE